MKLVAVSRGDGGASIMALYPIAIKTDAGETLPVQRIEKVNGEYRYLLGAGVWATASSPGVKLVYSSPDDEIAKWSPTDQAAVTGWREIGTDDVPADRAFRNAWTDTGKAIEHDMPKARDILRDKLRVERAPLLATLDIAALRADETSDAAAKDGVVTQKDILRDVTADPRIEAAQTTAALKALTLDVLVVVPAMIAKPLP